MRPYGPLDLLPLHELQPQEPHLGKIDLRNVYERVRSRLLTVVIGY